MKKILLSLFLFVTLSVSAQNTEQLQYVYHFVEAVRMPLSSYYLVTVDNGVDIQKLQDAEGKNIKFKTPAGVLTYLSYQGWEFYQSVSSTDGYVRNGTGDSSSSVFWIIRKPVTKEDAAKAVKAAIKE